MTTRLFAMVVIVLAAVSGLLSANGKQSPASGWIHAQIRVAHVTGAVTVAHAQGIIAKLYNDDSLLPGDVVITAKESSAVLVFSSGSTVSIGPASKTVVAEFTQDPFPADVIPAFSAQGLRNTIHGSNPRTQAGRTGLCVDSNSRNRNHGDLKHPR